MQVFFDGKPDADTRAELKSSGFRWAPAWAHGRGSSRTTPSGRLTVWNVSSRCPAKSPPNFKRSPLSCRPCGNRTKKSRRSRKRKLRPAEMPSGKPRATLARGFLFPRLYGASRIARTPTERRFYAGRSKPKNGCPFDQDNEAHRKSAGCRSWQGGSGAAKAPPEGADPAGTPEREKADEPLGGKSAMPYVELQRLLTGSRRSSMWTTLSIK